MYTDAAQLGSLKSFFKKSRDLVHKFIPRELSPTRMLEKYSSDNQKKGDAKLASIKSKTANDAKLFEANQKKIAALNASLSSALPGANSFAANSAPSANNAPATDNTWLYAGAAALAVGAVLLVLKKKKRK
jgi:LPXTG-motif cell wall-anchored protein